MLKSPGITAESKVSKTRFKEERVSREVFMGDLMKKEDREIKREHREVDSDKIREFKKKISDKTYLEHAITRIATDLSHYLTK
jgi:hypothetical protein